MSRPSELTLLFLSIWSLCIAFRVFNSLWNLQCNQPLPHSFSYPKDIHILFFSLEIIFFRFPHANLSPYLVLVFLTGGCPSDIYINVLFLASSISSCLYVTKRNNHSTQILQKWMRNKKLIVIDSEDVVAIFLLYQIISPISLYDELSPLFSL